MQTIEKPMNGRKIKKRPVKSGILAIATLFLLISCTVAHAETILLSNVPDYAWQYGCSPTSATMLVAYYAYNGHDSVSYSNLMPGFSSMPLNSFSDPTEVDSAISAMAADMGTNESGSTTFWYALDGEKWTAADDLAYGYTPSLEDGLYKYITSAGYNIDASYVFNQQIYGYDDNTQGFTFAQFEAQINDGIPLMVELDGHSMLGYGYSTDNGADTIYVHDTWNPGGGTMEWGGNYGGMQMVAVTDFLPVPEPCGLLLAAVCLLGLAVFRIKSPAA